MWMGAFGMPLTTIEIIQGIRFGRIQTKVIGPSTTNLRKMPKYYDGKPTLFGLLPADQQICAEISAVPICGAQVVQMLCDLLRLNGMTAVNEKEQAFILMNAEIAAMILFGYECSAKHMRNAKKAFRSMFGKDASTWKAAAPIFSKPAQELWG